MAYSSIKAKRCRCKLTCDFFPTPGFKSYYKLHCPPEVLQEIESEKKRKEQRQIGKVIRTFQRPVDAEDASELDKKVEKEKWFQARRKEMTGRCLFCGGKSEKSNDKTFRSSIAHLLAKKDNFGGFPSVATHEDNWLELCYYNNSCHENFDRHMITWELLKDSAEWNIIVAKFKRIYPFIAESEKRNIPELLLKEIKY